MIAGPGRELPVRRQHRHEATSKFFWALRLLEVDAHGDAAVQAADLAEWNDHWVEQFAGVDAVIHLAGNPSPQASWASAQRLNIDLTANVYEAAAAHDVRRLVATQWSAVGAEGVGFAVLNLMSDNPGMRWDIETTKRMIGYAPQDGAAPVVTEALEQDARLALDLRRWSNGLEAILQERRW